MTEATKTTKINGVYCVSNAIGGGMKNAERTKKECDALCGECVSYDLGKPQPWEIVSTWPEDIRREYLKKLYWDYGGSWREIADLLGTTYDRIHDLFNEYSIPRRPRGPKSAADKANWSAFLSGKRKVKDIIPKETVEQLKTLVDELAVEDPREETKATTNAARVKDAFLDFVGSMTDKEFADFFNVYEIYDLHELKWAFEEYEAFHRDLFPGRLSENVMIGIDEWLLMTGEENKLDILRKWMARNEDALLGLKLS